MSLKYQIALASIGTVAANTCETCLLGEFNGTFAPAGGVGQTCQELRESCALENGGMNALCVRHGADGKGGCPMQALMAITGCCGADNIPKSPVHCPSDSKCEAVDGVHQICPNGVNTMHFTEHHKSTKCIDFVTDLKDQPAQNFESLTSLLTDAQTCANMCDWLSNYAASKGCCSAAANTPVACSAAGPTEPICPHGINNIATHYADQVVNAQPWETPKFQCEEEITDCLADDGALTSARCHGGCSGFQKAVTDAGCCYSSADHAQWTIDQKAAICPDGITKTASGEDPASVVLVNWGNKKETCQNVLDLCTSDPSVMESHTWCNANGQQDFTDFMRGNLCCEGIESGAQGAVTFVALALGVAGLFRA